METINQSQTQTSDLPISPNAMAGLSYFFGPIAIAALFLKQYEKDLNVRFHAFQSILMHVAWILISTVVGVMVGMMTAAASLLLGSFQWWGVFRVVTMGLSTLSLLLTLSMIGVWITMIVSASQGKRIELPLIGKMAERFARN